VPFGWTGLALLAAAAVAVTWRTLPRRWIRPRITAWSAGGLALLLAFLVHAWPTFAAKPLDDYDGWAIWGMKAKALTLLDWADPALFASAAAEPAHRDYPLLLPSLEAVASRAMGGFDPRLVHLQFLLFAVAGIAALHGLLRDRVRPWLLWPFLLALVAAPAVSGQLLTAYADVPLALFVAAAVVAAARWIDEPDARMLALATVFFAAAVLTKNEGIVFVAAALLGLLLATRRWKPVLLSALAVELVLLPWQIWLAVHDIRSDTVISFDSLDLDHPRIGPNALRELVGLAFSIHEWPLLLPLFLVALALAARTRVAWFAGTWALVSMVGLAGIYVVSKLEWSNYLAYSGDRVIDSVLVGAVALTPLLLTKGLSRIGAP
jgi:cytochrome c biogenesis protein CcdA